MAWVEIMLPSARTLPTGKLTQNPIRTGERRCIVYVGDDSGITLAWDIALVVVLNKQLGLSFGTIVTLLRQRYGLTVTRSGLVHAVHRAARQARPPYDALCAQVRGSPMVSPDVTGWEVGGHLQWLWAFAT